MSVRYKWQAQMQSPPNRWRWRFPRATRGGDSQGGAHVDGSDGDDTPNRTGVSSRPAAWDVAELLFFLAIALVAARTGATYVCHQGPGGSGRFGSSTGERFSIADEILG